MGRRHPQSDGLRSDLADGDGGQLARARVLEPGYEDLHQRGRAGINRIYLVLAFQNVNQCFPKATVLRCKRRRKTWESVCIILLPRNTLRNLVVSLELVLLPSLVT